MQNDLRYKRFDGVKTVLRRNEALETGFDQPHEKLPDDIMTNFICPYCLGIPRDPIFLTCGHLICLKCGLDALRIQGAQNHTRDKGTWVPCPKCRCIFNAHSLDKVDVWNSWSSNVFNSSNVDCTNGCGFVGPSRKTERHEVYSCRKRKIECPHETCNQALTAEEMCDHFKLCSERQVYCSKCRLPVPNKELTSHDCIARMHKALDGKIF